MFAVLFASDSKRAFFVVKYNERTDKTMIHNKADERTNDSGYYDLTAYRALRDMKKQERRELIQKMNNLANQHGYQIVSIIKLREIDFDE